MVDPAIHDDIDSFQPIVCHVLDTVESCKEAGIFKNVDNLMVVSLNIRSMNKNFDSFVTTIHRTGISFDVIVLTECWLNGTTIKKLPGFNSYHTTTYINKAGGVIIYVKENLNVDVHEPIFAEGQGLILNLSNSTSIIATYRSPSFTNPERFQTSLESVIKTLKPTKNVILIGDLNINTLEETDATTNYLCMLAEHGYLPAITLPTRLESCLDHIFVRTRHKCESIICNASVTDHDLIMCSLQMSNKQTQSRENTSRKVIDHLAVVEELKATDWSPILGLDNVEIAAAQFNDIVCQIVNSNTTISKIPCSKRTLKPWITPGLLRCMKHRDRLHLRARKNPNDLILKLTYSRYRNFCCSLLRKVKKEYFNKKIDENKGSSKGLWKTIKTMCDLTKKNITATDLLTSQHSKEVSLNYCNSFFVSVGPNLAQETLNQLNKTQNCLVSEINIPHSDQSFFMQPTDSIEVRNLILKLKNDSAPGNDGIGNSLVKKCTDSIVTPLVHIFNLSLAVGIFPQCWKTAVVTPIYKSGNKSSPTNYRPISLLTTFSKLLEKLVNNRMMNFFETKTLLGPFQFGFRPGRSTDDAVSALVASVSTCLDKGECCIGVFLDLAKAFDTVSIPLLLEKLSRLGIRGSALGWFSYYLSNRKQHTRIGNQHSTTEYITFGVPQGSILGPSLFIAYLNDINYSLDDPLYPNLFCYADDTAVIFSGPTWDEVLSKAETGMGKINGWLRNNLLTLNTEKTKLICFHKTKASAPTRLDSIKLHNCYSNSITTSSMCSCSTFIKRTDFIRYLGVILDENLNFESHIEAVSTRARKLMFIMRQIRDVTDEKVKKMVYFALCESVMSYCISTWGGAAKTKILKLERAQRATLKVLHRKPFRYPTDTLYCDCGVPTIRQIYITKSVLTAYKTLLSTPNLNEILSKRIVRLPVPLMCTRFGQRFSQFLQPHLFNKLVKLCTILNCTIREAKHNLREFLDGLGYNSIEDLIDVIS